MKVQASIHEPSRWFEVQAGPAQPRSRLICFPYAGGAAYVFRGWRSLLDPDVDLLRCELPGRGRRIAEPLVDRIDVVVDELLEALRKSLDLPYVLFGHSMGALLAFELCRKIRRVGARSPERLFVSAHRAPHLPLRSEPISDLPAPDLLAKLAAMSADAVAPLENEELQSLLLPAVRADLRLCERYRYEESASLDVAISAYGGVDDAIVTWNEIAAWRAHTTSAFSLEPVAAGHFFLEKEAERIAAAITSTLRGATAQARTPGNDGATPLTERRERDES